jgi:hypothetical protein
MKLPGVLISWTTVLLLILLAVAAVCAVILYRSFDWEAWRLGGQHGGWVCWWLGSLVVGCSGGWVAWWLGVPVGG